MNNSKVLSRWEVGEDIYFDSSFIGSSGYTPYIEDEILKSDLYNASFNQNSPALTIGSLMHEIIHKNNLESLSEYSRLETKMTLTKHIKEKSMGYVDYDFLNTILDIMPIDKELIQKDSLHFEEEVGRHVTYEISGNIVKLRYKPDMFYVLKDNDRVGYLVDWKSYGNSTMMKKTYRDQAEVYSYNLLQEFDLDKIITIYIVFNKQLKKVTIESAGDYTKTNDAKVEKTLLKITKFLRNPPYKDLLVETKYLSKYLSKKRRKALESKNPHVYSELELKVLCEDNVESA